MLEKLKEHHTSGGVRGIVLSPTRELAYQSFQVCRKLSHFTSLRSCVIVGGESIEQHFIGAEMPVGRESENAFLGVAQDDVAKLTASVNDALFELMPDDAQAMASRRKIVRWDNKRKRYVRGTVGELRDNAHIRNESGQLIRGKSKVKRGELYEKWRQKHRVDQQAMGETGETRETSGRRRGREKKTKGEKHILRGKREWRLDDRRAG